MGLIALFALLAVVAASIVALVLLRRIAAEDWRAAARACLTNEGIKFLAFCGATGAGVALTAYLVWNTAYLHARNRDDNVFVLAVGSMILLGLTQLSLHRLLGAKQAIEIEFWKLKAKIAQGDSLPTDLPPPAA